MGTLYLIDPKLPLLSIVSPEPFIEWYELHKGELIEDWDLCQNDEAPKPIEPLE